MRDRMEIGSMATQVWETVENAYQNLIRGAVQSSSEILLEVEKSLDRLLIIAYYAPAKVALRDRIKYKINKECAQSAKKVYTEIEHIKNVVDKDIKGNFSEAIQKNITRENERWKKLSNNNIDFETVFQNNETIYY